MVEVVEAPIRQGKTLYATSVATYYSNFLPKLPIFANYKLRLPNFTYTPLMFIPFSKLMNGGLVIFDDVVNQQGLGSFVELVTCASGKLNLDIIFTTQRIKKFIPPVIRDNTTYFVTTKYEEYKVQNVVLNSRLLIFKSVFEDFSEGFFLQIRDVIKKYENIYDTAEIVLKSTDRKVKEEILKNSVDIDDLDHNISMIVKDSRKRQRWLTELTQLLAERDKSED